MLKYGSDCSGLDAPLYALQYLRKNIQPVFASDTDKYVREMIKANHNISHIYDNISKRPATLKTDIYFAGFPCQSFSSVGKRAGFDDERGTVFFDVLHYISNAQPKVAVLENVKGLLTHDNGNTFRIILQHLSELGNYNIYHDVLSPHTHGNWPQYRQRVFIVCIRKDIEKKRFKFPEEIHLTNYVSDVIDTETTGALSTLAPCEKKHLAEHKEKFLQKGIDIMDDYYIFDIQAKPAFGQPKLNISPTLKARRTRYFVTKLKRKLSLDESRIIQGLPEMNVVVSNTQYEKQIGNSICMPVLIRLFTNVLDSIIQ